jgi:hypothetical protein
MHLTNYAINKENTSKFFYSENPLADIGHKRSLHTIMDRLRTRNNIDTDILMEQIKDIIIKTMLSI